MVIGHSKLGFGSPTLMLNTQITEWMMCESQDFVLLIKAKNLDNPRAFAEYNEETGTNCVMLTMVPRFTLTEIQSEIVFVVDR